MAPGSGGQGSAKDPSLRLVSHPLHITLCICKKGKCCNECQDQGEREKCWESHEGTRTETEVWAGGWEMEQERQAPVQMGVPAVLSTEETSESL